MISWLIDIVFPPQCLVCRARVAAHGTLCLSCWQGVHFISEPMCALCGTPFDFDMGGGVLCARCLQDKPSYSRLRSAFLYDDNSKKLITQFKYADQMQLSKIYGKWMLSAGDSLIENIDVIAPVPLHYWRFLARRFNQSALLASEIAKYSNKCYLPNLLQRIRYTKQQTGLSRAQRAENVKNAFTVSEKLVDNIVGKNVLLVDDVVTTGSTIEQCSKALLFAGAYQVFVLTLARASA